MNSVVKAIISALEKFGNFIISVSKNKIHAVVLGFVAIIIVCVVPYGCVVCVQALHHTKTDSTIPSRNSTAQPAYTEPPKHNLVDFKQVVLEFKKKASNPCQRLKPPEDCTKELIESNTIASFSELVKNSKLVSKYENIARYQTTAFNNAANSLAEHAALASEIDTLQSEKPKLELPTYSGTYHVCGTFVGTHFDGIVLRTNGKYIIVQDGAAPTFTDLVCGYVKPTGNNAFINIAGGRRADEVAIMDSEQETIDRTSFRDDVVATQKRYQEDLKEFNKQSARKRILEPKLKKLRKKLLDDIVIFISNLTSL